MAVQGEYQMNTFWHFAVGAGVVFFRLQAHSSYRFGQKVAQSLLASS
jgi:hypothetical protein